MLLLAGAGRAAHAPPAAVLALQRAVGNARTSTILARPLAVQRDPYKIPEPDKSVRNQPAKHRQGTKELKAGTMRWSLAIVPQRGSYSGGGSAVMQIVFTPKAPTGSKISFLQTVAHARIGDKATPMVDVRPGEFDPFYGADWDPATLSWTPEPNAPPEGYRNQPSTTADPSAYLYDEPSVPPTTAKMFESVAWDMDSAAPLGVLRWGFGGGRLIGGEDGDCVDRPSAEFGPAVESFYATPTSGTPADSGARFEAILDDFAGGDATLTPAHRKELDRVAAKVVAAAKGQRVRVLVAGFGDRMDRDAQKASQLRTESVVAYLRQAGVTTDIVPTWFGSSWARAPVSMKEGRNRRVQIKVNYPRP
jgi:hypothetical protein